MKKSIFTVLMAFCLALSLAVSAYAAPIDGTDVGKTIVTYGDWHLERINKDTQWELDSYIGTDEEVVTPRIIDDMLVVAYGDHCFMNNTTIKNVITSSPLWTIGEYAFIDCTALESIELNFALDTIEVGAFSGTSSLKDINLQDSIVTEIKPYTFLNSGIEEVELPETCTKLGNYAFGQCYQLRKITIPKSVSEIDEDAFKLSDNVVIYCYTDSVAHQYAEEKGIEYVLIDALHAPYILGDADGDGETDIVDATVIQRTLSSIEVPFFDEVAADVDGSGEIESVDAAYVMRYSAYIITPYAVGELVDPALGA